jgi:hypothetical protein
MNIQRLYQYTPQGLVELENKGPTVDPALKELLEKNLATLLSVRPIASDVRVTPPFGGTVDTLGLDPDNRPVVVVYQSSPDDGTINRGVYYLDWLRRQPQVFDGLNGVQADSGTPPRVSRRVPRLVCIASFFSPFDVFAVELFERDIDLVTYRYFGDEYLMLEIVASHQGEPPVRP